MNIGFDNEQIYFELGNVAFWLNPIAGNFPHLDKLVKSYERFSWLNVHADDASFVTQRLDNLPGKEDHDTPIYVELNSYVSVRGCDAAQSNATELRLSRSHFEGKSVVMSMNRRFLKNALNFGIHRIGFDPDEQQPEIGFGERKTCIVMPLEGTPPNLDTAHITVLSSSDTPAPRQTMSKPKQEVPTSTQSEPVQKQKSKGQLLEEAEKLREALRESLVGVNGLIKEIKSQKRHDKLLRDTVASLRKLQDA